MIRYLLKVFVCTIFVKFCFPQSEGLLLLSNRDLYQNNFTALISNDYQIFHQWDHPSSVHSTSYLLDDSTLITPLVIDNPIMQIPNHAGGRFQKLNWDNEVIWDFTFFDTLYTPHHDIEPLPNGNILVICWEVKSAQEAINLGRQNITNEIWPTMIVELQPPDGNIVWEWHLWDHTIQDFDPSLENFGVISDHPELLDINLNGPVSAENGDWLHVNAIDYNEELDQILFSSRHMNEIYIIDHSTTSEEASSHSGGNSGKGGDFLFRWGNPMNYHRGDTNDIRIVAPHAANWVGNNYPGGGNILIFNNNPQTSNSGISSEVIEIQPPLDFDNNYLISESESYGPETPIWSYGADSSFFSGWQSDVIRLRNGNTLITVAQQRYIFEIDINDNIVWQCHTGGNLNFAGYPLRSAKIEFEWLHNNKNNIPDENNFKLFQNYPNPFNPVTTIRFDLQKDEFVNITIYDLLGNVVNNLLSTNLSAGYKSVHWKATNNQGQPVSAGVYFYSIKAGEFRQTKKMILLK